MTDLTHGRPIWFGPDTTPDVEVGLAVSASAALPGLMTPVQWDGRLLADGGAFVRLGEIPLGADRIVISDVSTHDDARRAITSLGRAVGAYIRARERATRPPRRVCARPVTVLRYAPLVDALPAFPAAAPGGRPPDHRRGVRRGAPDALRPGAGAEAPCVTA